MKIFMKTGMCLILAIILNIHDFDPVNKKWLVREIKKSKDVNKNVIESIRHKEYVNVLFSRGLIRCNMKKIQSKLHRIRIYDVWKI